MLLAGDCLSKQKFNYLNEPAKDRTASRQVLFLVGDTNDTASRAGTGVASLQTLLVATLAQVVGAGVDDNGAADDALGADQLDKAVLDRALGVALGIGLDVAEVTDVAVRIAGGTVGLAMGVDCLRRVGPC